MKSILFIGHTGRGKTSAVKNFIAGFSPDIKKYVYDINNEYRRDFPDIKIPSMDIEKFLDATLNVTDSVIVYEEATIFFSTRGRNDKMISQLVRKRHTRNFICLCFHSLRTVPTNILEMVDYVHLFATNDNPKMVYEKFSEYGSIINQFNDVRNGSVANFHYNTLCKNTP